MSAERMYGELASWWRLMSPPEEYLEEAELFRDAIVRHAPQPVRTLLELGSGGGHAASHLKRWFEMTLVDPSDEMLEVSRALNPELAHRRGDMRNVRLGSSFDAVFIHDAISYMTTRSDLRAALESAFVHCATPGVALFAPDETRERFVPETSSGGSDDGDRGLRYLEWVRDPDPGGETYVTDYAFLLRESDGSIRAVHDRHVCGLFPKQVWLDTMAAVGFEARAEVVEHTALSNGYELFIGLKR